MLFPRFFPLMFAVVLAACGGETLVDEPEDGMPGTSAYERDIEIPIVQARCVTCHVAGGVSGNTPLVFHLGEQQASQNEQVFEAYLDSTNDAQALLLEKVRGGAAHGGGSIFSASSTEYQDLANYLSSLTGEDSSPPVQAEFFEFVQMESADATLRRAALLLAGRLPTEAERLNAAQSDEGLRITIKSLMSGPAFHAFLLRGANDKLLTDAFLNDRFLEVMDSNAPFYPELASRRFTAYASGEAAIDAFRDWARHLNYGITRAPLELIAYVVENDRPYTEILTANYTMVNPYSAEIYHANASFHSDDATEFVPGQNRGQILVDDAFEGEFMQPNGINISSHGAFVEYPHAGVLNEPVFLNRYPTTDTNRNRARARWTFFHFLDVDIERSAPRTTDPEALADTNNPTLNNPNCTVCHQLMDPVAGAYQNYGNVGWYRNSDGGLDALPRTYKRGDDSPYQLGDTWYRDMLEPGFDNAFVPDADRSLAWLATQITDSDQFAVATVKFWWSAVMSEALLTLPENRDALYYEEELQAYEAQQSIIDTLATQFREGMNGGAPYQLKDLLTGMILSNWFRADQTTQSHSAARQAQLTGLGKGRLLTPEELENKTRALLGFAWGENTDSNNLENYWSNLNNRYRIYYGGIDSDGIVERATAMNSLMANVAEAQALSVSCPAVVFDFNRPDEEKQIFTEVDRLVTPVTQGQDSYAVTGSNDVNSSSHVLQLSLNPGTQRLRLVFENPYWDAQAQQSLLLVLHDVRVSDAQGQDILQVAGADFESVTGISSSNGEGEALAGSRYWDSTQGRHTGWVLWNGYIDLPLEVEQAGTYSITVQASRQNIPNRTLNMGIAVNSTDTDAETLGRARILAQLQQLHHIFLGENLTLDDPELLASYDLLVELWQARAAADYPRNAIAWGVETCEIPIDGWWNVDRSEELSDPEYMQGVWVSMLIYFLTDFRYLHE